MERKRFESAREFEFDPQQIWVISFPNLENLLVIDARPGQTLKQVFLLEQTRLLSIETKRRIQQNFQECLDQTETIDQASVLLPDQIRQIITVNLVFSLLEQTNIKPGILTEKVESLPLSFLSWPESAAKLWSRWEQSFFQRLSGEIDLIADLRRCFEKLILEERGQVIKGDGGYHTLWQNPSTN